MDQLPVGTTDEASSLPFLDVHFFSSFEFPYFGRGGCRTSFQVVGRYTAHLVTVRSVRLHEPICFTQSSARGKQQSNYRRRPGKKKINGRKFMVGVVGFRGLYFVRLGFP